MSLHVRDAGLLAEEAWNNTKVEVDPEWAGLAMEHKSRLLVAIDSLEKGSSSDIAGLEAFEEEAKRLYLQLYVEELKEQRVVSPAKQLGEGEDALPDDLPGREALAAAKINTYSKLEKVKDLTTIPGIDKTTAKKLKKMLEEE